MKLRLRWLLVLALAPGIAAADVSPTTGLQTDRPYRPVMVQYAYTDPEAALPLWGLSQADIVYEMIFWGPAHTRNVAIFNDAYPEKAGGIRGTRVFVASLREAWDCPLIAYGGQDTPGTSIYEYFAEHDTPESMVIDGMRMTKASDYFGQDEEWTHPHSRYFDVAAWVEDEWPEGYVPRDPGLTFSDTPSLGVEAVTALTLRYDEAGHEAGYTYDDMRGVWARAYNGHHEVDAVTGDAIACANIIVQANPMSYAKNNASRPIMETTGSGPFAAFIDGTMMTGTWSREAENVPVIYTLDGGEALTLRPGKTYIHMVPTELFDAAEWDAMTLTYGQSFSG